MRRPRSPESRRCWRWLTSSPRVGCGGPKAPLIFDDPVTSLDYRRLDEVAARIQNLAETHQVVEATHNIMFASALLAARQNKKLRTKIYEVRDGGEAKGILAPDVEPRLDTPDDPSQTDQCKASRNDEC